MSDAQQANDAAYRDACRKHLQAVEAAARKRRNASREIKAIYRHALDLAAHAYRIDMEHADHVLKQALAAEDANPPF